MSKRLVLLAYLNCMPGAESIYQLGVNGPQIVERFGARWSNWLKYH